MVFGTLTISYRDNSQETVKLTKARYMIGAAPDNDIVLRAPAVAPHQAVLHCDEQGCELRDCASGIPTWLGVIRVHPEVPEPLKEGAVILMGRVELNFHVAGAGTHAAGDRSVRLQRWWKRWRPWIARRRRWPRYMLFLLEAGLLVLLGAVMGAWTFRAWESGALPFHRRPAGTTHGSMVTTAVRAPGRATGCTMEQIPRFTRLSYQSSMTGLQSLPVRIWTSCI